MADPDRGTTRLGFLSSLSRREALPSEPEPVEEAPDLPPPGTLIEPYLRGDAFLEDVHAAVAPGIHVWWLGQSGFLIRVADQYLLLDPYLSDTLTERYAGTATPYERLTAPVIEPGRLAFVDAVACTNGNPDHLDQGTLAGVLPDGAQLVCPEGSEILTENRLGRLPDTTLAAGDDVEIGDFHLIAVPAYHQGTPEAVGFVIRNGPYSLYHAGDTRRVQGIAEAVGPHGIDVALVPVNGRLGNMGGADAARLAYEAGASIAVPCHYEMFRNDTASPARFVAECVRLRQEYRLLRAGEGLHVDPWADEDIY